MKGKGEKLRKLIEEAMAEVDAIPKEKHKNLLGGKHKYINAIAEKLSHIDVDHVYCADCEDPVAHRTREGRLEVIPCLCRRRTASDAGEEEVIVLDPKAHIDTIFSGGGSILVYKDSEGRYVAQMKTDLKPTAQEDEGEKCPFQDKICSKGFAVFQHELMKRENKIASLQAKLAEKEKGTSRKIHKHLVECNQSQAFQIDDLKTSLAEKEKRIEELESKLTEQINRAEWWKDDVQRRSRKYEAKLKSAEAVVEAIRKILV